MTRTALISEVNTVLGMELHDLLLSEGWNVIPCSDGKTEINNIADPLDLLIISPQPYNWCGIGTESETPDSILKRYSSQTLDAMRMIQALLPSMQSGLKRIVFIIDQADSAANDLPGKPLGCVMASGALCMLAAMASNELRQEGFTVLTVVMDAQSGIGRDKELLWCRLEGSK